MDHDLSPDLERPARSLREVANHHWRRLAELPQSDPRRSLFVSQLAVITGELVAETPAAT